MGQITTNGSSRNQRRTKEDRGLPCQTYGKRQQAHSCRRIQYSWWDLRYWWDMNWWDLRNYGRKLRPTISALLFSLCRAHSHPQVRHYLLVLPNPFCTPQVCHYSLVVARPTPKNLILLSSNCQTFIHKNKTSGPWNSFCLWRQVPLCVLVPFKSPPIRRHGFADARFGRSDGGEAKHLAMKK